MIFDQQDMFNKAYIGLRNQDFKQSLDSPRGGRCLYRGPHGLKCAIGHCITDEDMKDVTENISAAPTMMTLGCDDPEMLKFGEDLQTVHDISEGSPESMERSLIQFAATHNLEVPT